MAFFSQTSRHVRQEDIEVVRGQLVNDMIDIALSRLFNHRDDIDHDSFVITETFAQFFQVFELVLACMYPRQGLNGDSFGLAGRLARHERP